jgi:hypothetical protein
MIESGVCQELQYIFLKLLLVTDAIKHALSQKAALLDPRSLDEDFVLLQHELLTTTNIHKTGLTEACRLGALLYIRSITRPIDPVPKHPRPLVRNLGSTLATIDETAATTIMPLLLWLIFMGGIATGDGTAQRSLFASKLASLTVSHDELSAWDGIKSVLEETLWLQPIHEKACLRLWTEATCPDI